MKLLKELILEAEDPGFRAMNKELKKIDNALEKIVRTLQVSRDIRVGIEFAKGIEPRSALQMKESVLDIITRVTDAQDEIRLVKFFQKRALQQEKK